MVLRAGAQHRTRCILLPGSAPPSHSFLLPQQRLIFRILRTRLPGACPLAVFSSRPNVLSLVILKVLGDRKRSLQSEARPHTRNFHQASYSVFRLTREMGVNRISWLKGLDLLRQGVEEMVRGSLSRSPATKTRLTARRRITTGRCFSLFWVYLQLGC